ncbi:MAG: Ni/Fe hydrogenase subunit alpha [Candidatus Altiarchaeota archaeon]|nr:Ni/Fe hydrogenase subunit alpha [Candidatus Altiarchaeota archaeon]
MKSAVPHYIAKIEGHGSLEIDFTENTAELNVHEGERLFEDILVGRNYTDGVFIPQRICGVCPTAHCMATIKALEYAFGVEPSETTRNFRKLMLAGQMLQSHALHLFFLVLPDYLKVDSALSLAESDPEKFKLALDLKNVGDKIVEVVGGRPVHPITPMVGGFSKLPGVKEMEKLKDDLELSLDNGGKVIDLFAGFKYPTLEKDNEFLSIQADSKYGFYGGLMASTSGEVFEIKDYREHIDEIVKPYSTAKFGRHHKRSFMVGALARVNLHQGYLNPLTQDAIVKNDIKFPNGNSYLNNLAQAVEILHFLEEGVKLIDHILDEGISDYKQDVKPVEGDGVGAVEAPRGTLYYTYKVDRKGTISYCDIITPTVQNLSNIESDAEDVLKNSKSLTTEKRRKLLDMLVRAYDPCITCSVH